MAKSNYTVYGYRWIVLLVFAFLNAVIQMNWITFAPITGDAISLYNTTPFWIVLLSMSFMVVYLFVSVPASYIIDKYGIRIGVGIGALLTAVFGYLRGVYATDYTMVCISQFGLAIAQPFIMNAMTKVAAEWFPINERATATGVTALAQFIGIIIAMVVTKPLAQSFLSAGADGHLTLDAVQSMLMLYGYASIICAAFFIILARDKPATPPCSEEDNKRISVFEGIQHIFKQKDMILLLILFFIGLGMFNAITTFIDLLCITKGYTAGGNEAGLIGAVMMGAGVLGAIIVPIFSDKTRKRRVFLILCLSGLLPGLVGLTFVESFIPLLISTGIFGFFFMGAAPIGYQYAAEVSHPAPESTSQGLIILSGQLSGTIFITMMGLLGNVSMDALADANQAPASLSLTPFMIGFIILAALNIVVSIMMKESPMVKNI